MISAKEAFNMAENSKEVSTKLDSIYEAIEKGAKEGRGCIHYPLDKGKETIIVAILIAAGYDVYAIGGGTTFFDNYEISWNGNLEGDE